jgi:UDP-glucuronate 4-epimerase
MFNIKNIFKSKEKQEQKILVTGCCGFIGSHLVENLIQTTNHEILGVDNFDDYYDVEQKQNNFDRIKSSPKFKFFNESILDTKIIDTEKPDIIIHLAANAGVRNSIENPIKYCRTNIEGHINLLEQAVKNNVERFIYASSSSVYGLNQKVPFSESDTIDMPNSPYAVTKKSMEDFAKLYAQLYNLKTIGLRFFTVYGPYGRPDMAPYKFLRDIYIGQPLTKYGDGSSYRDYTFIEDIVNGIKGALEFKNQKENFSIYNLGNNNTVTLNEFIKVCEDTVNTKAVINQLGAQKGDVPKTMANISKAQQDFNFLPSTSIKVGLAITFNWVKESIDKKLQVLDSNTNSLEDKLAMVERLFKFDRNILNRIGKQNIFDTNRTIEFKEEDKQIKNVVFTSYFTSKADPQWKVIQPGDDINYIKPWYESTKSLNLSGIVVHDGLSEKFIKKYETNKIKFRKYKIGNYSLNDERFIAYYLFLIQSNIENLFMTDGNDVTFTKNPFELIKDNKSVFIGRDDANKVKYSEWMIEATKKFEEGYSIKVPKEYLDMPVYSAGIIGGYIIPIFLLLRQMNNLFFIIDKSNNNNMTALNYSLFKSWRPNINLHNQYTNVITDPKNDEGSSTDTIISGFPLNSEYKKYETDSEAYIIHK